MATPSIWLGINRLNSLLTSKEKIIWFWITIFAILTSSLEVITTSLIVIFAQTLSQPEIGLHYLAKLGLPKNIAPNTTVLYFALMVGITYLIKNCVAALEVFTHNFSIQKINFNFKTGMLHRYVQAGYKTYLKRNSSTVIQVVDGDVERMLSSGMMSLAAILSESIVFAFLITFVIFMNPSLAMTIFVIGAVFGIIIIKGLFPLFFKWGRQLQEASLQSTLHLQQFFHAYKEIILLGKTEVFINAYQEQSKKKSIAQAKQGATNSIPRIVLELLFVLLFVASVSYLCILHKEPKQMLGILASYLYVGFRLMPGLNRLINQLNIFKAVLPSIQMVYDECSLKLLGNRYFDLPNFEFNNSINIKSLSFCYDKRSKPVLENVNITIKKGECIGVIGETGSGKSTFLDIIMGLLNDYDGTVLIDEKFPVNTLQWHRNIGYVPQSIYLTDDTIEANIAFGENEVDEHKLQNALSAAQLTKFIQQLPEGIKTIVGERGIRLSGGERQRIAIARVIYKDPEVLVFDEATSALDTDTETLLIETIRNIRQNRTVIMIAHRLSTLKDCDRIITVKEGKIYDNTRNNTNISADEKRDIHA